MSLPDRELTPTELRQLIESNARAIQASSNGIAELRTAIAETNQAVAEANRGIYRLGELMEQFFHYQAQTNRFMQEGLAEH